MAEYAPKSRNLFQKEEIVAKFLNAVFDFDYTGRQVFNMSHNEIIQTIYNLLHYESIMEHKVVVTDRNYGESIKYLFQLLLLLQYEPAQSSSQYFWDLISEHSDAAFLVLHWIANNEETLRNKARDFKRKAYFLGFSPTVYALDDLTGKKVPGEWKPAKPPRKSRKAAKKSPIPAEELNENRWLRLPIERPRPKAKKIKKSPSESTRSMCKDYAERVRNTYQSKIRSDLEVLVQRAMTISDEANKKAAESETGETSMQCDPQPSTSDESFLLPKDPNVKTCKSTPKDTPLKKAYMQEMLLEQIDSNTDEQNINLFQHLVDTNVFHDVFDESMDAFLDNFSLDCKIKPKPSTDFEVDYDKPSTSGFNKALSFDYNSVRGAKKHKK